IDARFGESSQRRAHGRLRHEDELTAMSLAELQGVTAAFQVSLIRVEAMQDVQVAVAVRGFVDSCRDARPGDWPLGRFEPLAQRLARAEYVRRRSLLLVGLFLQA